MLPPERQGSNSRLETWVEEEDEAIGFTGRREEEVGVAQFMPVPLAFYHAGTWMSVSKGEPETSITECQNQ